MVGARVEAGRPVRVLLQKSRGERVVSGIK